MKQFNAPIPGQSLTLEPKAYPWERPPEINDPEEAIQMHLTRLTDPDMLEAALDAMELGELDIHTLTKGIMRGAVANGIHSIDVALIAAPVVHEYLRQAADAAGIEVDDGFEDKAAKEMRRQSVVAMKAKKKLSQGKPAAVAKEPVATEPVKEKPRKGLMAKGDM
jgi:hypothetical protein